MKRVSVPSPPASTRATIRRTRLQLPAASWNSLKRRTGGRIRLETGRGARFQAADVALQRAGGSQAEDIVEAVRLAPVEHFRAGVVAVGAQQDLHLRPGGADRADQAPQKGTDFDALRPLRRAQDGGDEATILVEDDDRLEAVVIVMGIE